MDNFANKKQARYNEPEVSLDYFLYSCFEAEKMKKLQAGAPKYSPVIETIQEENQELKLDDFYDALLDTVSYYKAQYPDFGCDGAITMSTLNEIVPPFVELTKDLRALVDIFVKTNEVSFLRDQLSLTPMWQSVERVISSTFTRNHDIFLKFLFWSFSEKAVEEDEVGQRPPIGRFSPFAPRYPRPMNDRGPPKRGGGGGSRFGGDRDRGPRNNDRGDRGGNSERGSNSGPNNAGKSDRPPRPDRGPRPDSQASDRPPRGDRPPREGRRDRGDKPRHEGNGPRAPRERDPRIEEESVNVVISAARELRDNPGMLEFKLPPANSYYRLLQHQQVKKEGFHSRSEGEGQERGLVIMRTGENESEGNS